MSYPLSKEKRFQLPASVGVEFFEGVVRGTIVEPRGETAFGWDPIFKPEGYDKNFAEMSPEEKNAISMRRIAVEKLKQHLEQ